MASDKVPQIFQGLHFYVQSTGVPVVRQAELIKQIEARGGTQLTNPDHGLCRAIFVFAGKLPGKRLQRYKINKDPKREAKSLEYCQEHNIWTFHDLCTHLGRVEGDGEKNKQFVVDYAWVQYCIDQGMSDETDRWQGMEVIVKAEDPEIPTFPTMSHSATPMTPGNTLATPVLSPATRPSPATRRSSGPPVAATEQDPPPKLFSPSTDDPKTFHVFPHKGSALAKSSIIYHGGLIRGIESADYIIVDQASAAKVPILKSHQVIIDVDWLGITIQLDEVQVFDDYIITPIEPTWTRDVKPQLPLDNNSTSIRADAVNLEEGGPKQSRPSTGRKRAATLSAADQPVAKFKNTGARASSRPSLPGTSIAAGSPGPTATSSKTKQRTPSTSAISSTGGFAAHRAVPQPSLLEQENKDRKKKLRLTQIINELDGWCMEGSPGSRSAFLEAKRQQCDPGFDRVGFFQGHRESILQALSERGHEVREGTKVFGVNQRGPRKFNFNRRDGNEISKNFELKTSSAGPSRDAPSYPAVVLPQSTVPQATTALTRRWPPAISTVSTSVDDAYSSVVANVVSHTQESRPTSPTPVSISSISGHRRKRASTLSAAEEKRKSNLAQLVNELHEWCIGESKQSRTTFLLRLSVSKPGFERVSLFKRNRDYIFQALAERGVQVGKGSKIYGTGLVNFKPRQEHDYRVMEPHTPRAPARATSLSQSSYAASPAIAQSHQLPPLRPTPKGAPSASRSSVHQFQPTSTMPKVTDGGFNNEPIPNPYDVPLPFSEVCQLDCLVNWVKTGAEDNLGI